MSCTVPVDSYTNKSIKCPCQIELEIVSAHIIGTLDQTRFQVKCLSICKVLKYNTYLTYNFSHISQKLTLNI